MALYGSVWLDILKMPHSGLYAAHSTPQNSKSQEVDRWVDDDSVATDTAGNAPSLDRRRCLARIHPSSPPFAKSQ